MNMSLITTDPCFPQIPLILEPKGMCSVLQQVLSKSTDLKKPTWLVEQCIIGEKRHKPGQSFMVSYHLNMRNLETGISFDQVFTAKLYPIKQGCVNGMTQPSKQLHSSCSIPAVSHLPELSMMIWAFPYDQKLPNLANFTSQTFLTSYFENHPSFLKLLDTDRITTIAFDVLHYLPQRSCIIRYQITAKKIATSNEEKHLIIYGKHYRDNSGIDVYATMKQIATQISSSAKPLHYDSENKVLWQSHVTGLPFSWDKQSVAHRTRQIIKMADCVAAFHCCHLDVKGGYDVTDIERQLLASQQISMELDDALFGRIRFLIKLLLNQKIAMDWSVMRETPLHMDLKIQNFLIDNQTATLIDLDCVSFGDHLIDMGSLIANFYLNGLRVDYSIAEIDAMVEALLQRYSQVISWPVDRARLNWYIASAFIHEVLRRSIRQRDVQRMQYIEDFVQLSARYLTLSQTGF